MKNFLCMWVTLLICLCFSACAGETGKDTEPTKPSESSVVTEVHEETTVPTTEPVVETTVVTLPPHSDLYLAEVSQEQMIAYFNEVVLDMEYTEGDGDVSLVQKWISPILYEISGEPTAEDMAILEDLFAQLNEIEGFPGIYAAEIGEENLTISFLDGDTFRLAFSDFLRGEEADGAVQFWYYTDSNDIYTGRVGYRTDISQEIRNSVLLEEMINLLGFNDTVLREDSILYQYSSDATKLSDVDWVLVKLLYHPDILPGMNGTDCRTVLESLYY